MKPEAWRLDGGEAAAAFLHVWTFLVGSGLVTHVIGISLLTNAYLSFLSSESVVVLYDGVVGELLFAILFF